MRRRDNAVAATVQTVDADVDGGDCDRCDGSDSAGDANRWAFVRTPRHKPIFHQVSVNKCNVM